MAATGGILGAQVMSSGISQGSRVLLPSSGRTAVRQADELVASAIKRWRKALAEARRAGGPAVTRSTPKICVSHSGSPARTSRSSCPCNEM